MHASVLALHIITQWGRVVPAVHQRYPPPDDCEYHRWLIQVQTKKDLLKVQHKSMYYFTVP